MRRIACRGFPVILIKIERANQTGVSLNCFPLNLSPTVVD
jgi:hypothetical protein